MYLKVRPKRSTLIMGKCSKLGQKYCGPFKIMASIGPVAYRLALPTHIKVHDFFHVSLLNKYVYDPKHVIDWNLLHMEIEKEFIQEPQCILDWRETWLKEQK